MDDAVGDRIIEILKGDPFYMNSLSEEDRRWVKKAKENDPTWWKNMIGDRPDLEVFHHRVNIASFY